MCTPSVGVRVRVRVLGFGVLSLAGCRVQSQVQACQAHSVGCGVILARGEKPGSPILAALLRAGPEDVGVLIKPWWLLAGLGHRIRRQLSPRPAAGSFSCYGQWSFTSPLLFSKPLPAKPLSTRCCLHTVHACWLAAHGSLLALAACQCALSHQRQRCKAQWSAASSCC